LWLATIGSGLKLGGIFSDTTLYSPYAETVHRPDRLQFVFPPGITAEILALRQELLSSEKDVFGPRGNTDVLAHQPCEMPFIQYDDVIHQVSSTVNNPALGDSILPWFYPCQGSVASIIAMIWLPNSGL
jgi:hypothetical protein